MVTYLYDFNGIDTADGSGVPTPTGFPVLEQVAGSWRRLGNRAYTSTARNSNPILAAILGAGDVDASVDVSSGGGDALYVRAADAQNWIRARVRRYVTSGTYYTTEYEWQASYPCPNPQPGTSTTTIYRTEWGSFSTAPSFQSILYSEGHYGYAYSGWQNDGSAAYYNADQYPHYHSRSSVYKTGNTRPVQHSSSSTVYQVILEKSVAGTVTALDTVNIAAPSKLRIRAQGTTIQVYVSGATSPTIAVSEDANVDTNRHGIGRGPSDQDGQALDNLLIDPLNSPPAAPSLLWPSVVDVNNTTRLKHTPADPDAGDTQSKFDVQYWEVDPLNDARLTTATTVTISGPNPWWDVPVGTFIDGKRYEGQVRTYDASGSVGPWSTSAFFDATTAPGAPSIPYPAAGGDVDENDRVDWDAAEQDAYQVRVLDDLGAVVYDSERVPDPAARTHPLTFPDNNVARTIQVRVEKDLLWSPWASVDVQVTYTPPMVPIVTLTADPGTGSLNVAIVNPTPTAGEPDVLYNEVYVDDTGIGFEKRAANLYPNTAWRYMDPYALLDYAPRIRVVAVGENGTTSATL